MSERIEELAEELARKLCARVEAEAAAKIGRAAAEAHIEACFNANREVWIGRALVHLRSVEHAEKATQLPIRMWKLIKAEGHRYYSNDVDDEIAVSDASALPGKPWTADEGLLFLDRSRPIVRGRIGCFLIPLKDEAGKQSTTFGSISEVQFLLQELSMRCSYAENTPPAFPRGRWTDGGGQ